MRCLVLAPLLALAACIVVDAPPDRPAPPQPAPSAPPPQQPAIDERAAIARGFDYARDRGLKVDRVKRVHLDTAGRWHLDLRGPGGDRAQMLIDSGDGRLLKGHFRENGDADERDDLD